MTDRRPREGAAGFVDEAGVSRTLTAAKDTTAATVFPLRCRHGAPARSCRRCAWLRAIARTRRADPLTQRLYEHHVARMREAAWPKAAKR